MWMCLCCVQRAHTVAYQRGLWPALETCVNTSSHGRLLMVFLTSLQAFQSLHHTRITQMFQSQRLSLILPQFYLKSAGLLAKKTNKQNAVLSEQKLTFHNSKWVITHPDSTYDIPLNVYTLSRTAQYLYKYVYVFVFKEHVKSRPPITFHVNHSEPLCSG